jgi:hypothetical protein
MALDLFTRQRDAPKRQECVVGDVECRPRPRDADYRYRYDHSRDEPSDCHPQASGEYPDNIQNEVQQRHVPRSPLVLSMGYGAAFMPILHQIWTVCMGLAISQGSRRDARPTSTAKRDLEQTEARHRGRVVTLMGGGHLRVRQRGLSRSISGEVKADSAATLQTV